MFERFWRGRERHRTGAGLGLAIARDIMREHRGTEGSRIMQGAMPYLSLSFLHGRLRRIHDYER
ncbi:MAG TPA: hypothetical protein VHJ19_07085 [Gammaproteobacteria bacterium]|nr:hypothetical protein [Gammaproteobacteria bacterium]